MSHEQELNLGELELESELGFCRTQTTFAFGSCLQSGARKEEKKERKQAENMRRCLQYLRNLTAANRETATAIEGDK